MKLLFKKIILSAGRLRLSTLPLCGVLRLLALVTVLGVAVMPFASVAAAGKGDPLIPQGQVSNERLERVWARQLRTYERIGQGFERDGAFTSKVQQLIDRATENGKDVSAVQAALDAFKTAIKEAQPIYASANGIVRSHQGFDSNGKVTDPQKAQETVKAIREKLKAIKVAMKGAGKALHEAIKSFREANPRSQPTPET